MAVTASTTWGERIEDVFLSHAAHREMYFFSLLWYSTDTDTNCVLHGSTHRSSDLNHVPIFNNAVI